MRRAVTTLIKGNWISVQFTNTFSLEMKYWMNENINYDWVFDGPPGYPIVYNMYFENVFDAMAFKLMWS